ncbi:cation diffusion facilitator family transporter [Biformimicrobium ophioploci]|uniref:cation diffusion facilitator family transporter n=1 Tax=Biformimicrobium ophioploci TaxID=3036711 RepID=UPI0025573E73|nr:cation diffusion facilitator family transporter [Microbulbifer sp. NKW57]
MAGADSKKSIFYALSANGAITVVKAVAAFVTGSGSLLAEAVHSLADCGNQALLLLGLSKAKHPPSDEFPLGSGKEIYFWSFIVAILLFSMGGLFSINEGIHKLQAHEPLRMPALALGVLVFALFAEGAALFGCIREINKVRGERSLLRWFRESRQSELIVIFAEDLAALLGLSLAIIAVAASWITGEPRYDAMGSIAIGTVLVLVAVFLAKEVKDLLVGQGVEKPVRKEMLAFLQAQQQVDAVLNLRTLHMGTDVMVAIKARMARHPDDVSMIESINEIEKAFKGRFPEVAWLFFEPDLRD